MKTTIDLPDDLLIAAKIRAAEQRKPLRRIIEEGLRTALAAGGTLRKNRPGQIRWTVVDGGLPPGVDLSDRTTMTEWIGRSE